MEGIGIIFQGGEINIMGYRLLWSLFIWIPIGMAGEIDIGQQTKLVFVSFGLEVFW